MNDESDALKISITTRDDDQIVRVTGEVDLHTSPCLRSHLLRLIENAPARLVIDLTDVGHMDSSGVGTMVEAKRLLERRGGKVVLAGMQQRVKSVFEITQLDKFFTIVASVEEAREL
ncbi:MAG: STAS domain-containing protein [Planctomycetota bacterium]